MKTKIIISLIVLFFSANGLLAQQKCFTIDRSRPDWPQDPVIVEENTKVGNIDLLVSFPNPAKSTVAIEFSLAKETKISLFVIDIEGNNIRFLTKNELKSQGKQSVTWDGMNENNTDVPSGTYSIILSDGQNILSKKVIMLK